MLARAPERQLPNGARAIMADRREAKDSLDHFETPPWATRALLKRVLPKLGVKDFGSVWEPACGRGVMAQVLAECFTKVSATDICDYSCDGELPFAWVG